MASQQIQTLLAPPDLNKSYENAALFLNSRFNTLEDLERLEDVVEQVKARRDELQAELDHSMTTVNSLVDDTRASAELYRQAAQELSLERHALADELSTLSRNLISQLSDGGDNEATLLEELETMHRNLKELKHVKGYVQVIEHALRLSESAVKQVSSPPATVTESSISDYKDLYAFVATVSAACSKVEAADGGSTINLVFFLEKLKRHTWYDIKSAFTTTLLAAAEKIKWPTKVAYFTTPEADRVMFERTFRSFLELQTIGEPYTKDMERTEKDGLYPLEALVIPLSQRFKYHFEGTRETNQIHKPEWYFTHVLNLINDHRQFMETVITQLLSSSKYKTLNAWHEFTRLLFPLLSRKLRRSIPSLIPRPSLLAHTIYQALSFDAALAEEGFTTADTTASLTGEKEWQGVVQVILGKFEWLNAWIEGEKKFAENQVHEIISAPDAWQIADDDGYTDSSVDHDLQTTNSARRIVSLVEQITDRYSPLPDFAQRTRFLISVQLPVLEMYFNRISASLDAFETLSSALVRSVPGALGVSISGRDEQKVNVDTQQLTSGVAGVQRLCKAFLSSKYLVKSLESWSEQLFFLELWTEINKRASLRSRAQACSLLPDPSGVDSYTSDQTVFDALIGQYRTQVDRAHDLIVQHVCAEVESNLRAHLTAMISNATPKESRDDIAVPQTLLAPIALLSTHLSYLRTTLPLTSVNALYRSIASRLAEHIMQRQILYRGNVSLVDAKEIHAECELWVDTSNGALAGALGGGRSRVEGPWAKLLQAGRLLDLEGDTKDQAIIATFHSTDEEWERVIMSITGFGELSREDVGRILRRRS